MKSAQVDVSYEGEIEHSVSISNGVRKLIYEFGYFISLLMEDGRSALKIYQVNLYEQTFKKV
jgi:hypothetical protein